MRLEVSTVLLQWAAGGLAFLWVTTRHRALGIGYGWLLRGVYAVLAALALVASIAGGGTGVAVTIFRVSSGATTLAAVAVFGVSVARRRAGVRNVREQQDERKERVAAMVGRAPVVEVEDRGPEFPPALDLLAPVLACAGLFAAATIDGGPYALTLVRLFTGAALLGVSTDAMLLGHWYLVQPGLGREPLRELVKLLAIVWAIEVLAFLWPVGMVSAFNGSIDDGYGGLLGWIWLASAVTTIVLAGVTWAALKEKSYSAVMAATGLLYLAILMAFGTDLVARALLAS